MYGIKNVLEDLLKEICKSMKLSRVSLNYDALTEELHLDFINGELINTKENTKEIRKLWERTDR